MRQVTVPEGSSGAWSVERFSVSAEAAAFDALRGALQGYYSVPAGVYTRLAYAGAVIMSDTPSEMRDHREPVRRARGRVFIAGLGIGMVLQAVLDKPEVAHVTVLELEQHVYDLVAPHYLAQYGERLSVVMGDALTWTPPPGTHKNPYDVAWFDIWPDKCTDNLDDIARIKRRWSRWAVWKGFWAESMLRDRRRRGW